MVSIKQFFRKKKTSLIRKFEALFLNKEVWTNEDFKNLERELIASDLGLPLTKLIVEKVENAYSLGKLKSPQELTHFIKQFLLDIVQKNNRPLKKNQGLNTLLFMGINGTGKTTAIAKIAYKLKQEGNSVLLAACDTFRAAAIEQLEYWGTKMNIPVIKKNYQSNPSAVAYDAIQSALSKKVDYLLIDTSGRLHTKENLMQELEKMKKTIQKIHPDSPSECILVLDASLGMNNVNQIKKFQKLNLSGIILNKLDGTSKGGSLLSIKKESPLPIFFLGIGEKLSDLKIFNAQEYIEKLLAKND